MSKYLNASFTGEKLQNDFGCIVLALCLMHKQHFGVNARQVSKGQNPVFTMFHPQCFSLVSFSSLQHAK